MGKGGSGGGVAFVIHVMLFHIYLFKSVYISSHSLTCCHQLRSIFEPFCRPAGGHSRCTVPVSSFEKKGGGLEGVYVNTATTRPLTHTVFSSAHMLCFGKHSGCFANIKDGRRVFFRLGGNLM